MAGGAAPALAALALLGGALCEVCPYPGPPETPSGGEGLGAALGRWAWLPGGGLGRAVGGGASKPRTA